jgi:hypothetical protein
MRLADHDHAASSFVSLIVLNLAVKRTDGPQELAFCVIS